ncbi:hypothetical protein VCRA2113O324_130124 [Vibrio crassostreae]|nr:hypothetical protein VCRA2113O324_130124 [Vibrio crassostreae]CAK3172405.1 hypothetical protein VCRA217O316_110124 [Vibrio crassostreae]CAK3202275.1 hypothetical protein VCRA217O315_120123 [Vibrio crassostreae]CAK3770465.1 hypothetical protein VCRA2128O347_150106 [Vibrio crassostreae]
MAFCYFEHDIVLMNEQSKEVVAQTQKLVAEVVKLERLAKFTAAN